MATAPKSLDYAAYLKTPETMRRYDIVDGSMILMSPGPDAPHQETSGEIYTLLKRHVERHRSGEVYYAPLDVIISKSPLRARQPDVLYISNSRLGLIDGPIHGGPDLVVEILSPGNTPKHIRKSCGIMPPPASGRPGSSTEIRKPSPSCTRSKASSVRLPSSASPSACARRCSLASPCRSTRCFPASPSGLPDLHLTFIIRSVAFRRKTGIMGHGEKGNRGRRLASVSPPLCSTRMLPTLIMPS